MSTKTSCLLILLALLPITAAGADAQPPRRGPFPGRSSEGADKPRFALSVHSGYRALHINSPLFDDNEHDFGRTPDDFLAARYGFEFDFTALPVADLVIGFESGARDDYANYLDFTFDDGSEIEHTARLALLELTVGARIRLTRSASRFQPYLVGGLSGAWYDYTEDGAFLDFDTHDIFYDRFEETTFLPGYFLGAGADFTVSRTTGRGSISLFGEFRYARSAGEHDDDFAGFGDLELGRSGAILGFRFRF